MFNVNYIFTLSTAADERVKSLRSLLPSDKYRLPSENKLDNIKHNHFVLSVKKYAKCVQFIRQHDGNQL